MSTSRLQRRMSQLLSIHLGRYTIRENFRPEWLETTNGERLELDFLIEELNLAYEVQGKQHYMHVPFFHGKDGFRKQVERDNFKRNACTAYGIKLIEIDTESGAIDSVLSIANPVTINWPARKFDNIPDFLAYLRKTLAGYKSVITWQESRVRRGKPINKDVEHVTQQILTIEKLIASLDS